MRSDARAGRRLPRRPGDEELGALADAAKAAAERAGRSIDDAFDFIEASNKRIAALVKKLKSE